MTDDRPLLAGVCGDPILQSKSPVLFRHWFEVYAIDGHYVPLRIRPADFPEAFPTLRKLGFRGVNVTIPHKQIVMSLADEISEAATKIGAANTLTFAEDGRILADNSDAFGFIENIRSEFPDWRPDAAPALIVGAGGASRAAIHILLEAGCPEVRLTNRTSERAQELADHFGGRVRIVNWSERSGATADTGLIANSTSLGMVGQPNLELSLDDAPSDAIVTDMVYKPLETPLLADARAKGLRVVDGLGMLLHQARPGFERWFGTRPQVTNALRAACLEPTK